MVLAVQLFNKIKKKKEKKKKKNSNNMKKQVSLYFRGVMSKFIYFCWIYSFLYVLDIDITRNGNNLKLKVKSEFSLSMGLMVINHSNPYIHSTTVLCDNIKNIYFYYKFFGS